MVGFWLVSGLQPLPACEFLFLIFGNRQNNPIPGFHLSPGGNAFRRV